MSLAILGLGTSVPPCAISQARAAEMTSKISGHDVGQSDRLAFLYGLTGITRRHVAILDEGELIPDAVVGTEGGPSTGWRMRRYEESVVPVARRAAEAALSQAGVAASAITHLVTVSCTGFVAPGFDIRLIEGLKLDPSVQRSHVGFMGCHGALNGLRVARAFAASEPGCRLLLCAAELCSLHFSYGAEADRSVPNALFADGAAALVAAPSGEVASGPWRVVTNGSVLLPGTSDAMTWRIGDRGFVMTLSPEIPRLIRTHLRGWLERWLSPHGLSLADIFSWAVHPGGPKILDAVQYALGLDKSALADSREVLAGYGNMSSPTVLFILERLMRRDAQRPCVALGFGPGLVIEAALIL